MPIDASSAAAADASDSGEAWQGSLARNRLAENYYAIALLLLPLDMSPQHDRNLWTNVLFFKLGHGLGIQAVCFSGSRFALALASFFGRHGAAAGS